MSSGAFLMTTRVQVSSSTAKPLRPSAAATLRSSSWLPITAKTPCGASSGRSSCAIGSTNALSPKVT